MVIGAGKRLTGAALAVDSEEPSRPLQGLTMRARATDRPKI